MAGQKWDRKKWKREWRLKNLDKLREQERGYYLKHREKILAKRKLAVRLNAPSAIKARDRSREYMRKNKEKAKERFAKWRIANKKRRAISQRFRDKQIARATPIWVDKSELIQIYMNRPDGYHVDHIVPLRGKTTCGLHVPWNLQYLPAALNMAKGNKFDE